MPSFFNNLSIRNKLIVLIGGTVSLLTASVLGLVWMQSLKQARSIVQEQLDNSRQLFDSAQQARYRAFAFETASNAAQTGTITIVEHRDREAACAQVARLMQRTASKVPRLASIRLADGTLLAFGIDGHPACDPQIMSWRLPDVHEAAPGAPEITTWTSPEKQVYLVFAVSVPGRDAALGTLTIGAQENDDMARAVKLRAGVDVALWQEDDSNVARITGISDAKLQNALITALEARPDLRHPFSFQAPDGEYEVEEVVVSENGMAVHNPGRVHSALLSSVTQRMQPFRILEIYLASLAVVALLLGICVGFVVSHPISAPLIHLADAAREIEQGKYDLVEQLRSNHAAEGGASADEIGTLSRAFVDMAGGLKQRTAMSKYMSRSAYQMLEQDGKGPAAERKWLALVFSDVRGFTAFSDGRDPALVIERMNDVLAIEADAVRRYGGDVDKFVGDAMFAWFSGADRCTRAVAAAAEIVAALHEKFGGAGTQIGFGIHVGEVVVGSMGSQDRRDYTAIGRSVNLASRLCSSAEAGQILVSQAVAMELEGAVSLNPLPAVTAKGFSEPVQIFEVDLSKQEVPMIPLK